MWDFLAGFVFGISTVALLMYLIGVGWAVLVLWQDGKFFDPIWSETNLYGWKATWWGRAIGVALTALGWPFIVGADFIRNRKDLR